MDKICAKCGSDQVIENVRIDDTGKHASRELHLVVHADPTATFFKEGEHGRLIATLCCGCGDLQIRCAADLQRLWKTYLHAGKKTINDIRDDEERRYGRQ